MLSLLSLTYTGVFIKICTDTRFMSTASNIAYGPIDQALKAAEIYIIYKPNVFV